MSKVQVPKQAADALRRLGPLTTFTETTACRLISDWCKCNQAEAKAKFEALCQTNKIEKAHRAGISGTVQLYTLTQ